MANGFIGKILIVNLTSMQVNVESRDERFFKTYMGGQGIGLYYLLNELSKESAFSPDNLLIFAAGLLTGTHSPCAPRYTVISKSPLTGGLGKSEAGGFWGAELKRAGYDAVVIKGRASLPVYVCIYDDNVEIRNATKIWGKVTGEAEDIIKDELNDKTIKIAQIGPAGENRVYFAGIVNELSHFNGRNGLGAVMGSKNLKAIVVKGKNRVKEYNSKPIIETLKWVSKEFKNHPLSSALHEYGTPLGVGGANAGGVLPTNNWQTGVFDKAEDISVDNFQNYLIERGGCYSCPIKCKRVVEIDNDRFKVDKKYGGPEYETLSALGSNCGIGNVELIIKANEICNMYGIDTISTGMAVSFAMHCFEEGLLSTRDTDGLELRFGNEKAILPLIEKIAYRNGFGNILADGTKRASEKIGRESKKFLLEVKGQEIPMHDPRVKTGLGLQYALSLNGADHWFAQHDPFFTEEVSLGMKAIAPLGFISPIPATDLSLDKVKLVLYTSWLNSLYDLLGICVFGYVARSLIPLEKMVELVNAATGWNESLFSLMKSGERALNMEKMFNAYQGFTFSDDKIPSRFFEAFKEGPNKGNMAIDKEKFHTALEKYYILAGWDIKTAKPTTAKLRELGLNWLCDNKVS